MDYKNISDICFIVQARLNSQRVPNKMLKPFGNNTTLFDIVLDKITSMECKIPITQFYVSVNEDELKQKAREHYVNIFNRTYESANCDNGIKSLFEWYNKLPFKYVILISACNPFLTIETINNFIKHYLSHDINGQFAVIENKNYYWNRDGKLLNKYPEDQDLLNTKAVEPTYEAGHCLYASKMDDIENGKWVGNWKTMEDIELFSINQFESLDIDYKWQFNLYSSYYKELKRR